LNTLHGKVLGSRLLRTVSKQPTSSLNDVLSPASSNGSWLITRGTAAESPERVRLSCTNTECVAGNALSSALQADPWHETQHQAYSSQCAQRLVTLALQ
jgi:hypothetical protein